jgi:hypothetical protein
MADIKTATGALIDMGQCPEAYVDGIARIDDNGPTSQLIFYMRQNMDGDGARRVVAARLIVPTAELANIAMQIARPGTMAAGDAGDGAPLMRVVNH